MGAIFRVLAAGLIALALVLLVSDGTAMLAADGFVATPLGETIAALFPNALGGLQERLNAVHVLLWEPVSTTILSWPGWAVAGALGIGLAVLGRTRAPRRLVRIDQD